MPIYEYLCEACGAQLDLLQKMNEPAPPTCQSCGAKDALKKRVSMSAFHLKGGGWYSELYASKAKGDSASNTSADANNSPNGAASENKNPDSKSTDSQNPKATAPSPCAGCPAASSSACAGAQKP
jgi:putative FmdB family regulatory protein